MIHQNNNTSTTYTVQADTLTEGNYIVYEGKTCLVLSRRFLHPERRISKIFFFLSDIFTGERHYLYESSNVDVIQFRMYIGENI